LIFLIIERRRGVGVCRNRDCRKRLTATARSPLGDLSSGGDCPDLLGWFEGVDDERIDGRDVDLMVLMNLMVLTS
jgi:hypothetical protein